MLRNLNRLAHAWLLVVVCLAFGLPQMANAKETPRPEPTAGHETDSRIVKKIYAIADLVVHIDGWLPKGYCFTPLQWVVDPFLEGNATKHLATRLIKLIKNTIAVESWVDVGGTGSIDYHWLSMTLIVKQSATVHKQIAELLKDLRRLDAIKISVELRMLKINADMAKQLKRDHGIEIEKTEGWPQVVYLDDKQLFSLMESLQADGDVEVVHSPQITVENGRRADLKVPNVQWLVTDITIEEETLVIPKNEPIPIDTSIRMRATVPIDRRSVRLSLDLHMAQLETVTPPPVRMLTTGQVECTSEAIV